MSSPRFAIFEWRPGIGWVLWSKPTFSVSAPLVRWCEAMNLNVGPGLYNFKYCVKLCVPGL